MHAHGEAQRDVNTGVGAVRICDTLPGMVSDVTMANYTAEPCSNYIIGA